MTTLTRSYSELIKLPTFKERLEYLTLSSNVGEETFGYNRYLNQMLYRSRRWRDEIRPRIIIRDDGCDLGIPDRIIPRGIVAIIHHINPITVEMILDEDPLVFSPENLICTSLQTHNAIHYGRPDPTSELPIERSLNDTCPWKL